MLKKITLGLLGIFIALQLVRPAKNIHPEPGAVEKDISTVFPVPDRINNILKTSCADCHSNNTRYPWYARIQPLAWWLNNHVEEGKDELNFNEFASYRPRRQYHKLEEIIEQVKEGEMPLKSYTLIHQNAKLNESQREELSSWANALLDSMRVRYPADSLRKNR
jgi:hypothetical protein